MFPSYWFSEHNREGWRAGNGWIQSKDESLKGMGKSGDRLRVRGRPARQSGKWWGLGRG